LNNYNNKNLKNAAGRKFGRHEAVRAFKKIGSY
jgi:hypothetical protein